MWAFFNESWNGSFTINDGKKKQVSTSTVRLRMATIIGYYRAT
jgi:hypothetical protein